MKIKNKVAFSIAESLITLAIVGVAIGTAAPLISKSMRNSQISNLEIMQLRNEIEELKRAVPKRNSIIFTTDSSCPDGWSPVTGLGGHYPRIAEVNNNVGVGVNNELEQMVHKHKHVSPYIQAIDSSAFTNSFRYGPFRNSHSRAAGGKDGIPVYGDGEYPELEAAKATVKSDGSLGKETEYVESGGSAYLIRGHSSSGEDANNWYMYTSDGMNRDETLSVAGGKAVTFKTCPNRDENDAICKPSPNIGANPNEFSYEATSNGITRKITVANMPYLADMAIVGEENRPNSVIWLACKKD